MGEIRERVTLTNATDDGLARRGLLAADEVRRVTANAAMSDADVRCRIPPAMAEQLGLHVGREGWTADVAGPVRFACQGRDTIDEAVVGGEALTIGRTVLAKWGLGVDPTTGRLVPYPGRPNQPVSMVR